MPTFVHTGDIHLDTPFSANFNGKQMQIRRHELMQTFRSIVLAAKEKDFLFICGDLFDGKFVSQDTISFVKQCFQEIPDTHIFIVAGNHDPYLPGSAYDREEWGEHVHIFGTEWEFFDFPEKRTRIHGRSFGSTHVETPMLNQVAVAPDWCNLMLLHGEVVSKGGKSNYNPIEKDVLGESGMDYVALGHIHQRSDLLRQDGVSYAYCGIPEGRGFDEDGEKGCYIGEAEKGRVSLSWTPCSSRAFTHLFVDVTEAKDRYMLQNIIEEKISGQCDSKDCIKVVLTGKARPGMIDCDILKESMLQKAFFLDFVDETKPEYAIEEMINANSLRGDFVNAMMERIGTMSEEEQELGYLALELGLSAMERGQSL